MILAAGSYLGPYEILSAIGAGGMGEVYRARDTKLNRDVALKILPDAFAKDPDRLARFTREAQLLAALNHPNIAHIHGLEEGGSVRALVMEFVEGEDLAQRIMRGAIPVDEALPIARQIGEALEAAHEQGIIHRDLKPANIKIRPDGTVKVLDFGLAKALDPAATGSGPLPDALTMSPTITSPALMTNVGVILGTAAYMSPEQARGLPVDRRSDVWAFGCVFFEMLTGTRVFAGDDVTDTIAAVVRAQPDWDSLPTGTPPAIRRLLRRSLEKDRKQRLPDIGVARLEIDEALSGAHLDAPAMLRRPPTSERFAWIAVATLAVLAVTAVGVAATLASRSAPAFPEMRVDIQTPPTTAPGDFALSPDGLKLAFVATQNGQPVLWLRSLEDGTTRAFARTEGAESPFWSPDSRSIAFVDGSGSGMKRIDVADGVIRPLAALNRVGRGGTWNREGVILAGFGTVQPLWRVSALSRTGPVAVTRLTDQELGHGYPQFLPDGRHFLYYVRLASDVGGINLGALDGAEPKRLATADGGAIVAAGHLFFPRQGAIFAQPLDMTRFELTGEPVRVTQPAVEGPSKRFSLNMSASATGVIAFRASSDAPVAELIWFDRTGKDVGRIPVEGDFNNLDLSQDEHHVALRRTVDGNNEIWAFDVTRRIWSRLATDPAATQPLWSSDGRRIVFVMSRQGNAQVLLMAASAGAPEEPVLGVQGPITLESWSPDGRYLLYSKQSPNATKGGRDIWAVSLEGEHKAVPVVQTPFDKGNAQFSPDGKWIAYESNESARYEIYVQPWPGPGERVQISTSGGAQARWRRDGKELFYLALDGRLMAVPLRTAPSGQSLEPGPATELFRTQVPGGAVQMAGGSRQQYAVSADGLRFLVRTAAGQSATTAPITVILNWKPKS
jgi:Tol biopolymer transport system component